MNENIHNKKFSYNLFVYYRLHIALFIIRFKKGAHAYTVQVMKQMKNKITMKSEKKRRKINTFHHFKLSIKMMECGVRRFFSHFIYDSIWIFPVARYLFLVFVFVFFVPTSHFMLLLICTSFKLNDRLRLIFFLVFLLNFYRLSGNTFEMW